MPISPYDGYTAGSNWIRANQPVVVTNVSALRALDKTEIGYAITKGYYTAGDGGAGEYWYDSSDTTSTDNGGSVILAADGGRWKLIINGVINSKQFGAKGDGVTDDTSKLQAAIDYCVSRYLPLFVPAGGYLTGPLTLNGSSHTTPANAQYSGLISFYGEGRRSTVFVAKTGLYPTNQYVLSANNVAGVEYRDFGVSGNSVTSNGIDFSWAGGSGGSASTAPSNQNIFQNIFCEGCSAISFNLSQCNDSKISGLWCRGGTAGSPAVVCSGVGGKLGIDNLYVGDGTFVLSCQDAGIVNSGLYGGVVLSGTGYNVISFESCHIYPDSTTGFSINSTALGNATRGVLWSGCYFDAGGTYTIGGRYWNGMKFIACKFSSVSSGILSTEIVPAAGAGHVPVFDFDHCDFESTIPGDIASVCATSLRACRGSSGDIVNDYKNITTTGTITSTAERQTFGSSIIDSLSASSVPQNSGITLNVSAGAFLLSVLNFSTNGASSRTSSLYFIGTFQGDEFTSTLISTSNGSGGGRSFTVTQPTSSTILIKNTSSDTCDMSACIFGVGG